MAEKAGAAFTFETANTDWTGIEKADAAFTLEMADAEYLGILESTTTVLDLLLQGSGGGSFLLQGTGGGKLLQQG